MLKLFTIPNFLSLTSNMSSTDQPALDSAPKVATSQVLLRRLSFGLPPTEMVSTSDSRGLDAVEVGVEEDLFFFFR